jgi:hypothetical protein
MAKLLQHSHYPSDHYLKFMRAFPTFLRVLACSNCRPQIKTVGRWFKFFVSAGQFLMTNKTH